jgi:hypothetical protein
MRARLSSAGEKKGGDKKKLIEYMRVFIAKMVKSYLHHFFFYYYNNKKILEQYLSPIALAIWIMDAGG